MKETVFKDFGSLVLLKETMKERLPKEVFEAFEIACAKKGELDNKTADVIAEMMKDWAIENGCTHFCHWFQPLTGSTAEKHDSFVENNHGELLLKFSGKSLIKGEPDASSFPNGGLRATFEARGYTYWDLTSPAFIRGNTLCIPSIFISYNGEFLDKKGPLLKSIELLNHKASELLHLIGYKDIESVKPYVGLEQEYFLIDRPLYKKRLDLILTGRTLFGHSAPKGQELDDHYFGAIPTRVAAFMKEVNEELWKLGVYAKTEHNEVAPRQFELAAIFNDANIAVDQNQMMMDVLKRVAYKHDFACLLHEKPFAGINGSGKHNNYSLICDDGTNLFAPGKNNKEQLRFLLFISCFVKAVDTYPELLRMSVATPGNEHRLGANEAPPAIISIYLGEYLEKIIDDFIKGKDVCKLENMHDYNIQGFKSLPSDNSDRNRTSPIAFTGNKFEFRMLGSSCSAALPNIVLNTIIAKSIDETIVLLKDVKEDEIGEKLIETIKNNFLNHQKIIFSGDGYSEDWINLASKRGLPNIVSTVDAISHYDDKKNAELLEDYGIFTESELKARKKILMEQYTNTIAVEVKTLLNMTKREVLPSIAKEISTYINSNSYMMKEHYEKLCSLYDSISIKVDELEETYQNILKEKDEYELAKMMGSICRKAMEEIRKDVDSYEAISSKEIFKVPSYSEILF